MSFNTVARNAHIALASVHISPRIGVKCGECISNASGTALIFARIQNAIRLKISRVRVSRQGAAQVALFAMLLQAMIPLSAAVPLPGEDGIRKGQSIPNFYLVICTAYGAQTSADVLGEPLDKAPSNVMPWDCPVCQLQTSVQGPMPATPQVAFVPPTLPREADAPAESDRLVVSWHAAPWLARGPPTV